MNLMDRLTAFLATTSTFQLPEIASILGAEEFLSKLPNRKGHSLNIAGFISACEERGYSPLPPLSYNKVIRLVLPPDDPEIVSGQGGRAFKLKKFPRARLLQEVCAALKVDYHIIEGTNTPGMIRRASYKVFILKEMNRLVMVNDWEGEATYIIHESTDWIRYSNMHKSQLRMLDNCTRIYWRKKGFLWKEVVSLVLLNGPIQQAPAETVEAEALPPGIISAHALGLELEKRSSDLLTIGAALVGEVFGEEEVSSHIFMAKTYNSPAPHFSAILASLLRTKFPKPPPRAGSFTSVFKIARKFKRTKELVLKVAQRITAERKWAHEDHIQIRKAPNMPVECLSPDLTRLVESKLPPPNWHGLGNIMNETHFGEARIRTLADEAAKALALPKDRGNYYSRECKLILFVSPAIFKWIVAKRLPLPEQGWEFLGDIGQTYDRDVRAVERAMEALLPIKGLTADEHLKWCRGLGAKLRGRRAASPQACAAYRELKGSS